MTRQTVPKGFWTVWTAVAVDLLGFGIVIPLLPLYADEFGASPVTIGLLFAVYSLAQFVFSPIWGRISDRIGRRPVLLVTIAGSMIGSLTLALAGSITVLFVGRIIDGMSGASVAVARATVADVADSEQRPRLMGLLGAAFGLGFIVGPSIGALAALGGTSVPFFVAAGISFVNLVSAAWRLPETRATVPAPPAPSQRGRVPVMLVRLLILTFSGMTVFSAFEATFALLVNVRLTMSDSTIAVLFAGVGLVLVVAQGGLVGPVNRRLGEAGALRLGLGLNVVGFVILSVASGWTSLIPGLVLLALGQGILTPTLPSAIAATVPTAQSGVALGYQQSASGLARVIGPILGGALFASSDALPFLVAALVTVIVLPLVPRLHHSATHPDPLTEPI